MLAGGNGSAAISSSQTGPWQVRFLFLFFLPGAPIPRRLLKAAAPGRRDKPRRTPEWVGLACTGARVESGYAPRLDEGQLCVLWAGGLDQLLHALTEPMQED